MRDLSINDGHVDTSCRDPAIAPRLLLQMFSHMEEEPPQYHRYAQKRQPIRVVREADVLQEIAEGDGDFGQGGNPPSDSNDSAIGGGGGGNTSGGGGGDDRDDSDNSDSKPKEMDKDDEEDLAEDPMPR